MSKPPKLGLHYHVQGYTSGLPEPVDDADRDLLRDAPAKLAETVADSNGKGLGQRTTVAILDTGFTHHPFLRTSLADPHRPIAQSDLDRWEMSAPIVPAYMGHGTFVAGVVRRYAPAAHIQYRRVTDSNGISYDWALAGAIANLIPRDDAPGPDVLNLSLGPIEHEVLEHSHGSLTPRTRFAIRALQDACGTIVVIAAGPKVANPDSRVLLAEPGGLTVFVGALGPGGVPAEFSADDKSVAIFAPGDQVLGTYIHWSGRVRLDASCAACSGRLTASGMSDTTDVLNFAGWARWSGTSFAAPAVAGAIASAISEGRAGSVRDQRQQALTETLERGSPSGDGHHLTLAAKPWLPDDPGTAHWVAHGGGYRP
jgi:subtilisin family serine protease